MTASVGRIMALDVGGRRIGVAMSDPTRVLASPLTTVRAVPHARALAQLAALVADYEVVELVVGLPLTLSGEQGPQAQTVLAFVEELRRHVHVPIHLFDERLTTVEAERIMVEMGLKRDQRREKIDEVAASIILRDFLGSREEQRYARDTDDE
ncbi:MAG TPA: Holliday junction resolvase RuvX [Roseiflexaceae bacterium]|nr:Holliday junction resolvase RuvX [Roseiflexaceae bacterium]